MLRLLTRDQRYFDATFGDAANFLIAARLRYECYSIVRELLLPKWNEARWKWVLARVRELLRHAPACQEPWFRDVLLRDGSTVAEALLIEIDQPEKE